MNMKWVVCCNKTFLQKPKQFYPLFDIESALSIILVTDALHPLSSIKVIMCLLVQSPWNRPLSYIIHISSIRNMLFHSQKKLDIISYTILYINTPDTRISKFDIHFMLLKSFSENLPKLWVTTEIVTCFYGEDLLAPAQPNRHQLLHCQPEDVPYYVC
jgi:hypothetical protein